jgi:hypothetical protein
MRRILLVLAATAVMLVLAAPSVTAKPNNKVYCAQAPIGGGDALNVCNPTKQACKERVAAQPAELNFGKCTKGFPE